MTAWIKRLLECLKPEDPFVRYVIVQDHNKWTEIVSWLHIAVTDDKPLWGRRMRLDKFKLEYKPGMKILPDSTYIYACENLEITFLDKELYYLYLISWGEYD